MPSIANSNAATKQEIRDVVAMTVFTALPDGGTFPDVSAGGSFTTANTAPTILFGFLNGYDGQRIVVLFKDTNTTVSFSSGTLKGNNNVNWVPILNDSMVCTCDGTTWYCVISRHEGVTDHTLLTNIGTNNHAAIDSALASYFTHLTDGTKHFLIGDIDHTLIQGIGTNTHTTIDSHLADATLHGATYNWMYNNGGVNFTNSPQAPDSNAVAIGELAITSGQDTLAIGTGAYAEGQGCISIGTNSISTGSALINVPNNIALGGDCLALGDESSIAIGNNAVSSESGAMALGTFVEARGIDSVVIGNNVSSDTADSVVIGSSDTNKLSLVGGKLSVDTMYKLTSYTVATLPTAEATGLIYVSDAVNGLPSLAFSDGTSWLPLSNKVNINAQIGTAYTLVLTDISTLVTMSNASANILTVPPSSSVAFDIGTQILIEQKGAGVTTIAAGAGVTLNSAGALLALASQYSTATLIKEEADTWLVVGDLA